MYLLDTNVISEIRRPRPEPRVIAWLDSVPASAQFLSVLTLGEIRRGVEGLSDATRKEQLRLWLEVHLPQRFGTRLLAITSEVADRWGRLPPLPVRRRKSSTIDRLLAATALRHGLRIVTRNEEDFTYPGLEVINPWRG
jgi:hypothetical protein